MSPKRFREYIANLCTVSAPPALVALAAFIALAAFASLLLLLSPGPAPVIAAAILSPSEATTTTVASWPNPSVSGQMVSFTSTTVYAGGPVTGTATVTFTADSGTTTTQIGTASVVSPTGVATVTYSTLSVGTYTITAEYAGDATFDPSTGTLFPHTVNKADTTTELNSSPNPSAFGQTVTFTATVGFTGGITPTGTVTFKDGAAAIGTGPLHASGVATFTTCTLDVGIHSVTAEYGGDANFKGSTSAPLTQVVGAAEITVMLGSAPNPSVFGQTVTLTATVTSAPCLDLPVTPTGIVWFNLEDDTTLGVGALDATGVATFTTSVLAAGVHDVTAVYAGDDKYKAIESAPLTHTVNRLPDPDLQITKTDNPDPVYAGQELFYEITVINNADYTTASGVVVTDTLPAEVTYIADTASCTYTPGPPDKLVCTLDDIAPGASRSFQIKTAVAANAVAATSNGTIVITNTAEVTMTNGLADTIPANNTVAEGTFIEDSADLSVVNVSKPDTHVYAGQPFTYTIIVENLGPSYARNVAITDTVLASGNFTITTVINDPNRAGDSCNLTTPASGTPAGVTFGCLLNEPLEPLSVGPGQWKIQVELVADETQDIDDLVSVTTINDGTPDPDLSNNQAENFISVTDVADLDLGKGDSPDPVVAGNVLTYTLIVTNTGPSTAENVVIEDNLPAEVEVVSVSSSSGTCNAGTPGDPFDPTTCTFGTVPDGGSRTMTIVVRVKPDAVTDPVTAQKIIHNDAWVVSDIFDPDNGDNLASEDTTVNAEADLSVAKTDNPDPVVAGELLNYTITVTNTGPSDAKSVVVVDELPNAGTLNNPLVTYISDTDACYQDPIDQAKLTCSLGDISAGDDVSFDILVQVNPDTFARGYASITNSVTVSSDTADPYAANNSDTETTDISARYEIYLPIMLKNYP